jgi:group I intron endonuclease
MQVSGIYTITNVINRKSYVGYTKNIVKRFDWHLCKLRNNKHSNSLLQRAWNKYGEENFEFEILEECDEEFLLALEHYWCIMLDTHNRKNGYNILSTHPYKVVGYRKNPMPKDSVKAGAIKRTGGKRTQQSKDRMSKARKKWWVNNPDYVPPLPTQETKNKIAKGLVGYKHSKETREKMSAARTGYKKSKEEIEKTVKWHKGSKRSNESKINMSIAQKTLYKNGYKSKHNKKVYQYDLENNFIKEWESAVSAARFYNVSHSSIGAVCRGDMSTCKNYKFSYIKIDKLC